MYTGQDTKLMKNSEKAKPKLSQIQIKTNFYIICICIIQIICCISASVYHKGFLGYTPLSYIE